VTDSKIYRRQVLNQRGPPAGETMSVFGSCPLQAWLVKLSQTSPSLPLTSRDRLVWLHVSTKPGQQLEVFGCLICTTYNYLFSILVSSPPLRHFIDHLVSSTATELELSLARRRAPRPPCDPPWSFATASTAKRPAQELRVLLWTTKRPTTEPTRSPARRPTAQQWLDRRPRRRPSRPRHPLREHLSTRR